MIRASFKKEESGNKIIRASLKKQDARICGAGGGTRTHMVLLPTDFESVTSANSITPAE